MHGHQRSSLPFAWPPVGTELIYQPRLLRIDLLATFSFSSPHPKHLNVHITIILSLLSPQTSALPNHVYTTGISIFLKRVMSVPSTILNSSPLPVISHPNSPPGSNILHDLIQLPARPFIPLHPPHSGAVTDETRLLPVKLRHPSVSWITLIPVYES